MTEVVIQGQVGPRILNDGAGSAMRQDKSGAAVIQHLHGRFYEVNSRGDLFSGGMQFASISNATFTKATLDATATPIAGVWNPTGSDVNLVILQAALAVGVTALQATGCGPFVWCVSTGVAALTLGVQPLNRKTLLLAGSAARDVSGVALTGLAAATPLVQRFASGLSGGSNVEAAFLQTQAGAVTPQVSTIEQIDGAIIVPPGGVLALLAAATGVAHSAASGLLWEEVPI